GSTATVSMAPDGGTTVEVYLPDALVSLDAEASGWRRRSGETPLAGASEEAGAGVAGLPFSALRFASRAEPPLGPETDAPEAVPVMLSAPVPSPAPGTPAGVTEREPVGAEPGDGPPIFESVRSGYLYAFGRDMPRFSEQQDGQSPAGRPRRPPATPGGRHGPPGGPPPRARRPTPLRPPPR